MSNAEPAAIAVRDVFLTYRGKGGDGVRVLEGVSFDVRRGEFVCIVGPSGCGKSTLLNVVGGFLRATRGEVLVQGEAVRGPDRRRIFVFQENGAFPWLTVEDNVGFGLTRLPATERERLVARYVGMVGLEGFERAYPSELSGGMRQRVEIARALAANPDVLYMDEPFGALDFLTRLKMRGDLIRIWQQERKTVLFVTHDIEEAVQLADRVLVMTPRPSTIGEVVTVDLPRPRDIDTPEYLQTRDRIFAIMGMSATGTDRHEARTSPRRVAGPRTAGDVEVDVAVIGGGPAGAILGAYLAQARVPHCIVDKDVHPRRHVGESLVCSTTRVFREIDFVDTIERAGFVRKYGALWTHFDDERPVALPFRPMPHLGIQQEWTWHVDRSRFDEVLLRHAAGRGSRVIEGLQVERAEFDDAGRARGVHVRGPEGRRLIRSRILVDASGRGTVLGSQLRLKRVDPEISQFAAHGWFEGVERGPRETAEWIHLHVLPGLRSWAWQIPISAGITSVGLVTDRATFPKSSDAVGAFFAEHVAANRGLARSMAQARPIDALHREGNYSYAMERLAGDGWLLIGDAAGFIDPLFSSGLSVAAESARGAARTILEALAADDVSRARLADHERRMRMGMQVWRAIILRYYREPGTFLALLADDRRRELLRGILQGDVWERDRSGELAELGCTSD
jgi:NitT/TauT family transport system ATP-binding protein